MKTKYVYNDQILILIKKNCKKKKKLRSGGHLVGQ